jgi:hypothetical protein
MEKGTGNFGSHLTSALLTQRRERCTAYRFPPCADRWNATAVLSLPPLPHRQHLPAHPD